MSDACSVVKEKTLSKDKHESGSVENSLFVQRKVPRFQRILLLKYPDRYLELSKMLRLYKTLTAGIYEMNNKNSYNSVLAFKYLKHG